MTRIEDAFIRQKVIDGCLGGSRPYSVKEMMEKCNIALEAAGYKPISSKVTIYKDIASIETHYPQAIISKRRIGRNVFYEYDNKPFSVYNLPLQEDEMAQLAQTIAILSKFEGMPNFDWIDRFINRFKSYLNIPTTKHTIVSFDENFYLKGRNWFTKLFTAISSQQALQIVYQPFDREPITYLFHPYLLKQYNKRWNLFGCVEGYSTITNLPLDRILDVSPAAINYKNNTDINFNEYFEDIVGVTRYDKDISIITIKVSKKAYQFIETKPLHGSQKKINEDENNVTIQIEVIINRELIQLLLSYGSDVEVISPHSLKQEIEDELKKTLQKYQCVHAN